MRSLNILRELIQAMLDDDFEQAAKHAQVLSTDLNKKGCPSQEQIVRTLKDLVKEASRYLDDYEESLEDEEEESNDIVDELNFD